MELEKTQRRLTVDFHSHTSYSRDSTLSPEELVGRARSTGLDRIAVTDHNRIDGAWKAAALDPSLVIVGEEIDCACGAHLIGLFLREFVPPGREIEETADRIRDQGGLIYAPHPYAYLRNAAERTRRVLAVADVVEVFNARAFAPWWNRRARAAAGKLRLPGVAGSDAHFAHEIGRTFTTIPYFESAAGLRSVLHAAESSNSHVALPFVHLASAGIHIVKHLRSGKGTYHDYGRQP